MSRATSLLAGTRRIAANVVRGAVRDLYCQHPNIYIRYRRAGEASSNESRAWAEVDAFVRKNRLANSTVIDLGCGAGSIYLKEWKPREYKGYDISLPLLKTHVLREDACTSLEEIDLEEANKIDAKTSHSGTTLILSILALHYLSNPAHLLKSLARPGHWFCFIVANAEHDRPYCTDDGVVLLTQNGIEFRYFSHELYEYVQWLGDPRLLFVNQCGYPISNNMHHPYYLICGYW
jgi:hypothetical protein